MTSISPDGFGFIAPDRHAGEIWIRPQSLHGETPLHEGQRVQYDVAVGSLGLEAAGVRPLRSDQQDGAGAV